jgi:hypothetical protein
VVQRVHSLPLLKPQPLLGSLPFLLRLRRLRELSGRLRHRPDLLLPLLFLFLLPWQQSRRRRTTETLTVKTTSEERQASAF